MNRDAKIKLLQFLKEKERRKRYRLIDTYFPDDGPLRRELYQKHLEFFRQGKNYRERLALAANRIGKALLHGTKVATPNGWRPIESLVVGDQVISGCGDITTVVNVFPQGELPIFSINFDNHYQIKTCAEHLWKVKLPNARYPYRYSHKKKEDNPFYNKWSVRNTKDLMKYGKIPRTRAVVPVAKPFKLPKKNLLIDPYILGCLLGDGGLTGRTVKFSTNDIEIVEYFEKYYKMVPYGGFDYGVNECVTDIRKLGLFGKNSKTKFIPTDYLYSSEKDRLELLQGLMDTDGSISKSSKAMEFSTVSNDLADGFEWLANSLGFKTKRTKRQTRSQYGLGQPSWRITLKTSDVCPFKIKRKKNIWKPLKETGDWIIHDIKEDGRGLATCIEVAHESHTFVIEHGIVTHNTETMGGYETVMHLTGDYPEWWEGRKFDRPIEAWAAGKSGQTVRDILQKKLIGQKHDVGTGLIKKEYIEGMTSRSGIPGAIDTIFIKHKSGGISELGFKSYDQGRQSFEGTKKDLIWLDEECPLDVYTECLLRTTDTSGNDDNNGMIMLTFTPLMGMSEVVLQFLPNGELKPIDDGPKFVLTATWDDVPHLTEQTKKELLASIPPFQRDARSKGVPQLGAGAIYPVPEDDYLVDDFPIPEHWPRVYGMDVGWNRTACIWGAIDRETDTVYLYSEHYRGEAEPIVHATSIKSRGDWIPGVIDPASRGRSQKDGQALFSQYNSNPLSLNLSIAENAVEAGIYAVWMRLSGGKLKVFKSLNNFRGEMRLYRRNEKGQIVKKDDHLMDGLRYLIKSGIDRAITKPALKNKTKRVVHQPGSWMG